MAGGPVTGGPAMAAAGAANFTVERPTLSDGLFVWTVASPTAAGPISTPTCV